MLGMEDKHLNFTNDYKIKSKLIKIWLSIKLFVCK